MSNNNEKIYFSPDITDGERASFEAGIKLGALYHILSGIPVSKNENILKSLEEGIEAAISCQPYVKSIKIRLDRNKIMGNKSTEFDYDEVSGKVISAELLLEYKSVTVLAKVDWIEELQYPLMYIEKINQSE